MLINKKLLAIGAVAGLLLGSSLNSVNAADQDIEAPDIDSIERELLKEWDRIVELAASSIVDG